MVAKLQIHFRQIFTDLFCLQNWMINLLSVNHILIKFALNILTNIAYITIHDDNDQIYCFSTTWFTKFVQIQITDFDNKIHKWFSLIIFTFQTNIFCHSTGWSFIGLIESASHKKDKSMSKLLLKIILLLKIDIFLAYFRNLIHRRTR